MGQSSAANKSTKFQQIKGRSNSDNNNSSFNLKAHNASAKPNVNIKCPVCSEPRIYLYDAFRKKSVNERMEFVRSNKLCFNCLAKHLSKDCKSQRTCSKCHHKHHSLLHNESKVNQSTTQTSNQTELQEISLAAPPEVLSVNSAPAYRLIWISQHCTIRNG